jgi:transcriptional regulator with XRE-family HTH domain
MMRVRHLGPLSLHEVFAAVDIHRPIDLARRVGITRQYAHYLWTGVQPISRNMARRIAQATGLPVATLMAAEVLAPPQTPRGRPPKRRPTRARKA